MKNRTVAGGQNGSNTPLFLLLEKRDFVFFKYLLQTAENAGI